MAVRYELVAQDPSGARAGLLHTRRGVIETPVFMPVATHANIRTLAGADIATTGAKVLLANTYHLMLRPGVEVFDKIGGIHEFMQWDGAVLTDSGGYQIFSLPAEREISENGADFRSQYDNSRQLLTPEVSIAVQQSIGSDIMMVLDVCHDSTASEADTRAAMERTHRWAKRSLDAKNAKDTGQALFGIVQGGVFPALRDESAQAITAMPFDGYAIGGLAVGEPAEQLYAMAKHTASLLPAAKPRYLMGVGYPHDLVEAVRCGVDMFDCIVPVKMAQQGWAYSFTGRIRISHSSFRLSDEPIDASCDCIACRTYSRAYVRHLMHGKHELALRLLALHNLRYYQRLMKRMREAIVAGTFASLHRELMAALVKPKAGDDESDG